MYVCIHNLNVVTLLLRLLRPTVWTATMHVERMEYATLIRVCMYLCMYTQNVVMLLSWLLRPTLGTATMHVERMEYATLRHVRMHICVYAVCICTYYMVVMSVESLEHTTAVRMDLCIYVCMYYMVVYSSIRLILPSKEPAKWCCSSPSIQL